MLMGIVADDLTGAADSVAPFAGRGYTAAVALSARTSASPIGPHWDVLAINTRLRDSSVRTDILRRSTVRRATRRLLACGADILFKKIDSTLRGYLHIELAAMLEELPGRTAIICPASPAHGRTVERGIPMVHGAPLCGTEYAPAETPERFATVDAAFEAQTMATAAAIHLPVLRSGARQVAAEIRRLCNLGARWIFCDAVCTEDLHILARAVVASPDRLLPVGSAGFSGAIAKLAPFAGPALGFAGVDETFKSGRVLVIVGSRREESRRQARHINGPDVYRVGEKRVRRAHRSTVGPTGRPEWSVVKALPHEPGYDTIDTAELRRRFNAGDRVFVLISPDDTIHGRFDAGGIVREITWPDDPAEPELLFDGYVLTGGSTAEDVCRAMQGTGLQIFGESEPGVVRGLLLRTNGMGSPPPAPLPIILKAGGFGDPGALARCVGLE